MNTQDPGPDTRGPYQEALAAFWDAFGHAGRSAALHRHHQAITAHALTPTGRLDFDIFTASVQAAHAALPLPSNHDARDRDTQGRATVEADLLLLDITITAQAEHAS